MFIALEGIDATGKSTLIKEMKKRGYAIYSTPSIEFKEERKRVDEYGTPEEQYRFYIRCIKSASSVLRDMLSFHKHVIVDRYWVSTLVYHKLKGVNVNPSDFGRIVVPDFTFFLTVDERIQQERLKIRGMSINDIEMQGKYSSLVRAYLSVFNLLSEKYSVIDTTQIGISEMADIVENFLR